MNDPVKENYGHMVDYAMVDYALIHITRTCLLMRIQRSRCEYAKEQAKYIYTQVMMRCGVAVWNSSGVETVGRQWWWRTICDRYSHKEA